MARRHSWSNLFCINVIIYLLGNFLSRKEIGPRRSENLIHVFDKRWAFPRRHERAHVFQIPRDLVCIEHAIQVKVDHSGGTGTTKESRRDIIL